MDQCDHQIDLSSLCRSMTYILWSSNLASCLEDYLLQKKCTSDDKSVSETDYMSCMWVNDLYFMVH